MVFKNLRILETYDSDEDDILNDFYIPILSNSVQYDRLAGYFSSTTLASSAKGMARFIENGGKMRLVTCVQISEQDQQAIREGLTKPEEAISRIIMAELDVADQLQKDHVAALAWMIADGKLEIKIAVPYASNDGFVTGELDRNSIYHQKIGILHDDEHNIVSFSGSINETGKAWTGNIEEFKVFCSWKPGQDVYGANDARKFEKFWHDKSDNTKVFDLPVAIKEHLITHAPKSITDAIEKIKTGTAVQHELRDYQQAAVEEWFESDRRGIFEMATGVGKTWTAVACMKRMFEQDSAGSLVVIACPYQHLVTQWGRELEKWGIGSEFAYDSSVSWQQKLGNRMLQLNDTLLKNQVIVTTHATFSSEKFIRMINTCKVKSLIIVDEVHKIGSEGNSRGLLDTYDFRLGLSATPKRYFDKAGTKIIFGFFGQVVFKLELDKAIRRGFLTPYSLFPHMVHMTDDEAEKYREYTRRIAIERSKERPNQKFIQDQSIYRANIVKAARNKIEKFREVLEKGEEWKHCLVYCVGAQMDDAVSILHEKGIIFHRITEKESNKKRDSLLAKFACGERDVLIAIKCLDEGVDVPSTRIAIILASSHNPIEFIQRRGRILRRYEGKTHAVIHDLIVLPRILPAGETHTESERNMVRNELARLREFARSSDNPKYSEEIISTFMNKYNLSSLDGES